MSKVKGFLKVYRTFFDSPEWQEKRTFSRSEAWLWLLANAHYGTEPRLVEWKGGSVSVARGQLLTSYRSLSEQWGWPKSKVERVLGQFLGQQMIKIGTVGGTVGTLITLCNYAIYNPIFDDTGTVGGTVNEDNRDSNQDIIEEYNRYKKNDESKNIPTQYKQERGFKGENSHYRIIINQKTYIVAGEELYSRYEYLPEWYSHYATNIPKIKQQLTFKQFALLACRYDIYDICRVLVDMDNYDGILKKQVVYHTLEKWLSTDTIRAERLKLMAKHDYYKAAIVSCEERNIVSLYQAYNKHHSQSNN